MYNYSVVLKGDIETMIKQAKKVQSVWMKQTKNELEPWIDSYFKNNITSGKYYLGLVDLLKANKRKNIVAKYFVIYGSSYAYSDTIEFTYNEFIKKFDTPSKYVRQLQFENLNFEYEFLFSYSIKLDKNKATKQAKEIYNFWKKKVSNKREWTENMFTFNWDEVYIIPSNPKGNFPYVMEGSSSNHLVDTIDKHIYSFEEFKNKYMINTSKYVRQLKFENVVSVLEEEEYDVEEVKNKLPNVRIIFDGEEYEGYIRSNETEYAYVRVKDFPGTKFKFSWQTIADSLNDNSVLETE